MEETAEEQAQSDIPIITLTEGLSLSDLINKGGATFEINFDDINLNQEETNAYNPEDVVPYLNSKDCLGLQDDDCYQDDGEPFESLANKMFNLTDDGKVKKRVLRKGYGSQVQKSAKVTIHYNAYLEYNEEPYDSTYLRKKPFIFRLGEGWTLPGLDLGVQTMKLNEMSQFLVYPDYAYGKLGCLGRVPENSVILFEVELKSLHDTGAASSFTKLSEEEQKSFSEIYKYANALMNKAKVLFKQQSFRLASREYYTAINILEPCKLRDFADQEKQQELLLRLRVNLAVSLSRGNEPRKACAMCNDIYQMCKGTSLNVPAKVYFTNAKNLMALQNYSWAEKRLLQAKRLNPDNNEIAKLFNELDACKKAYKERELALAKTIFRNKSGQQGEVTLEFMALIKKFFQELLEDGSRQQCNIPADLTDRELTYVKEEAGKYGLKYEKDDKSYCFVKPYKYN